jgi:hypothetical protein
MAKAKKVQRYVENTEIPKNRLEYKVLEKSGNYNDFWKVIEIYKNHSANDYYRDYYTPYENGFKDGSMKAEDWKQHMGEWRYKMLLNTIYPHTPEAEAISNALLAEYDSRPDLQEIYQESFPDHWAVYDKTGKRFEKDAAIARGYDKRPDGAAMFRAVVRNSNAASKKIELARETPYQEGDLVLLRKPFVGMRVDPLYVNPYSAEYREGARTPDESVPRIATVYGVTERTMNYYATKGSKIIQIQWMGKEDMIDIEEKYIKWHERPTYKNGMKVRPQ